MKRKWLCILLVLLLLLSTFTSVFAAEKVKKEKEYVYEYNGIEVCSNVPLSDSEIKNVIDSIMGGVHPQAIPLPDGGNTIVAGPKYQYYDNADVREAANISVAWVATKIPGTFSKSALFNWVFNKLTGWATAIHDTYVGSWVSKGYSDRDQMYKYYQTLVHFSDSTYKTPLSVQYYQIGLYSN